jgi:aspartyl-tRNA(Asn)/glutamyl-tRNA(Gln) amidotransferase subunit A
MNMLGMDATAIALEIREGRLTSVEAVRASLGRIAQWDEALHAFVLVLGDRALAIADARDRERAAGIIRGPLHGVPVAIKDLFDIEGSRTGAGSRSFAEHRAEQSATVVLKLEQSGAVIVGKTHTVEFAFGGWGTNPVLGAPWNPHDLKLHRAPGGSSSGSAVAVASGMVPLAIGTDTGGSVRIPAAFCGVFGHKSSLGLIGRGGLNYLSPSHDSVGVLARSLRDVAMATRLLAGRDARDPATFAIPSDAFENPHVRPQRRLRLASLEDPALALIDSPVLAQFQNCLADLARRYGVVEAIRLPEPIESVCDKAGLLMSAESYATLRPITEDPTTDVAPEIRARINHGRSISAADLFALKELKRRWKAEFASTFAPYDLLVMPGAAILPPPIDSIDQSNMVLSIFGRFVNMLDLCATSVPIGRSPEGLPIGLQIIARGLEDQLALQLGADMERDGLATFKAPDLAAA